MKNFKEKPTSIQLEHRFFLLYERVQSDSSYRDKLEKTTDKIKQNIITRLRSHGFEWVWYLQNRMDKKVYAEFIIKAHDYPLFEGEIYNMVKDNYFISEDKTKLAIAINYREYNEASALYNLLTSDFYTKELPSIELASKLDKNLETKIVTKSIKI